MANETFALLNQPHPETVGEDDYQSFCEALGASARGRAFLSEYARRNRHADTEIVLSALARFEAAARAQQTEPEADRIRQDLRALLDTLRAAKPQIDNSPGAIKAATLAALIDFVQARIEALVTATNLRAPLAEVPPPDQPELPIPSPAASAQPAMTLVQSAPSANIKPAPAQEADVPALPRARKIIPNLDFLDSALPKPAPLDVAPPAAKTAPAAKPEPIEQPAVIAKAPPAQTGLIDLPQPAPFEEPAASAMTATIEFVPSIDKPPAPKLEARKPAPDPLAGIMSLTEEERLALFT